MIEGPRGERHLSGGDKTLCINPVKFDIMNDSTCTDLEFKDANFRKVEIGGAKAATFEFTVDMFAGPAPQAQ